MRMKNWENYIKAQKDICQKYNVDWVSADKELIIGLADNILTSMIPINGLRHPVEKGTTGWYIWAGQEFSHDADFFKPYHLEHVINLKPEIIKYLGLPPGYRFLIDGKDYVDIWFDQTLLNIDE